MKEKYVKPALMVERFTLTQSIASGCEGVQGGMANSGYGPTQWGPSTCAWNDGGATIFTVANSSCMMHEESTDSFVHHNYCYNNPQGMLQMFSS